MDESKEIKVAPRIDNRKVFVYKTFRNSDLNRFIVARTLEMLLQDFVPDEPRQSDQQQ